MYDLTSLGMVVLNLLVILLEFLTKFDGILKYIVQINELWLLLHMDGVTNIPSI